MKRIEVAELLSIAILAVCIAAAFCVLYVVVRYAIYLLLGV